MISTGSGWRRSPNSDCTRLGELRDEVAPEQAERWAALTPGIRVRSSASPGAARLRLRFGELGAATQAALLQLDPVADREEYAELRALLVDARPESLSELAASDRPEARRLGLRLGNLGLEELGVWARADAGSVLDELDDPDVRCLVVDTGSSAGPGAPEATQPSGAVLVGWGVTLLTALLLVARRAAPEIARKLPTGLLRSRP